MKMGSTRHMGSMGFVRLYPRQCHLHSVMTPKSMFRMLLNPNGNNNNEAFKIDTTNTISSFNVFYRHGREIYSDHSGEWDGGNASSRVYFWRLTYTGCSETKEAKAWLHLLR